MRIVRSFVLAVLVTAGWGCSEFKEVHYFKDEAPSIPNYYRLKVKGWTLFTSSRYTSGYFDEKAVNEYFSETQLTSKGLSKGKTNNSGDTQAVQPIDTTLKGKKLVMILSSHSDAVASQIGSYVENENTMNAIALLVNRGQYQELVQAELSTELENVRNRVLLDKGDLLIDGIDPDFTTAEVASAQMLEYVNALAQYLGRSEPFTNLSEARIWFNYNRGHLIHNRN